MHHRDIAGKTQYRREPQEPEGLIPRFLCAAVKQNDDQRAENGKRDVAVNTPGQRRVRTCPCGRAPAPKLRPWSLVITDLVAAAPDIVQQHIEHRHGDGGDQFADTQGYRVIFQPRGAQGDSPGEDSPLSSGRFRYR